MLGYGAPPVASAFGAFRHPGLQPYQAPNRPAGSLGGLMGRSMPGMAPSPIGGNGTPPGATSQAASVKIPLGKGGFLTITPRGPAGVGVSAMALKKPPARPAAAPSRVRKPRGAST